MGRQSQVPSSEHGTESNNGDRNPNLKFRLFRDPSPVLRMDTVLTCVSHTAARCMAIGLLRNAINMYSIAEPVVGIVNPRHIFGSNFNLKRPGISVGNYRPLKLFIAVELVSSED